VLGTSGWCHLLLQLVREGACALAAGAAEGRPGPAARRGAARQARVEARLPRLLELAARAAGELLSGPLPAAPAGGARAESDAAWAAPIDLAVDSLCTAVRLGVATTKAAALDALGRALSARPHWLHGGGARDVTAGAAGATGHAARTAPQRLALLVLQRAADTDAAVRRAAFELLLRLLCAQGPHAPHAPHALLHASRAGSAPHLPPLPPPPPPPPPRAVSAQPHVADGGGSGGGGGGVGGGSGSGGGGGGGGEGAPIALRLLVEVGLVATVLDAAAHEQQPSVQAAALDVLPLVEKCRPGGATAR